MSQISIRMDDELREKTEAVLGELGLNISAAVNIFARQIVRTQGIPFQLTLANGSTANRQEAANAFVQFAKERPANFEPEYKFNREECYDG